MEGLSSVKTKPLALRALMLTLGGVALLFAASQVEIPLKPVPINLQTVAVMLVGLTYTPRRALESHLVWLGLAAAGFPMLSGFSGGLTYMGGPTLGYLIGFVLASFFMATLKQKFSLGSWKSDMGLCIVGTLILYACGVSWLTYLFGFTNALAFGVLPFIVPGIIKAGLLCTGLKIVRSYRKG